MKGSCKFLPTSAAAITILFTTDLSAFGNCLTVLGYQRTIIGDICRQELRHIVAVRLLCATGKSHADCPDDKLSLIRSWQAMSSGKL